MLDDIATIRETIEKHSGLGQELLLVLHSAGGFLGSAAMDGFALNARKEKGLKGGVAGIFFLAAGIAPEGFKHQPLPFFEYDVTLSLSLSLTQIFWFLVPFSAKALTVPRAAQSTANPPKPCSSTTYHPPKQLLGSANSNRNLLLDGTT